MSFDHDQEHRNRLGFLLRSALALASTTVVTAGLGFVYWTVAARAFPASDVGQSSTAIAAMNLIAPLTLLGLGTLLMTELPAMADGRVAMISAAALVTGTASAVVALVCAFVLPSDFLGLPDIGTLPVALLFAAAAATQSVGILLDQSLLSVLGGKTQLGRNAVQAVVKLVLLAVFAVTLARYGSLAIFSSWLLANVISLVIVAIALMRKHDVRVRQLMPVPSALRGLHFEAARHHVLNIALLVPYFAMPIVANVVLGSEQAAYLYAAWAVAGFVFFVPLSLSTALFASGARDSSTFLREFRKTLHYSFLACLAALVVIAVMGRFVLGVFGPAYAAHGEVALLILCVGGLGLIVKDHHVALARVTDDVGREAVLVVGLSATELLGAALGAQRGGLNGLTLGWLAAVCLGVVVYGPRVWQAYRGRVVVQTRASSSGSA